ncbi:DUF3284 domain-containing protein [Lacticaseibacillus hulanensis]|jgi:uncharacterized protein YndB with AHSA1/START domain|uniref:DUF3284 domain-containing protein n=1 Tax=Lacticaseibacillus hulanensis TaxID=2493111 RepID=UPI000FD76FD6|nr:DUF3284 domain-containing protein [Lacticaseibacillus hulanensis]
MQIKMTIAVPVEYYFSQIIESARYDIHAQTGKNVAPRNLKGFTYRKQMANGQTAHCTITDYVPGQVYAYAMRTGRNEFTVRYEVTADADGNTQLVYLEEVTGATKGVDANNRASGFLMGWFRKRRFKQMGRAIEQAYLGNGAQLTN